METKTKNDMHEGTGEYNAMITNKPKEFMAVAISLS